MSATVKATQTPLHPSMDFPPFSSCLSFLLALAMLVWAGATDVRGLVDMALALSTLSPSVVWIAQPSPALSGFFRFWLCPVAAF